MDTEAYGAARLEVALAQVASAFKFVTKLHLDDRPKDLRNYRICLF